MTQKKTSNIDRESQAFFDKIAAEHELTTAGVELLKLACATLTRWRQAKAILDRDGCVLPGAIQRIHPACKIEHDARLSFCRMLKELGLSEEFKNE